MKETWKDAVHRQRIVLAERLSLPLGNLAKNCEAVWGDREKLGKVLTDGFSTVPNGLFMYALDTNGIQISDNVCVEGLMPEHYGRDRSSRPYMREAVPSWGFLLSEADWYIPRTHSAFSFCLLAQHSRERAAEQPTPFAGDGRKPPTLWGLDFPKLTFANCQDCLSY